MVFYATSDNCSVISRRRFLGSLPVTTPASPVVMLMPFPHTTNSAADDFERIVSKKWKITIIEWITYD